MSVIYLKCDPEAFGGLTEIPVTLPRRRANIKHKNPYGSALKPAITLGEQVDEALKEWYSARGQAVPSNEVGIGAIIDAAEAAEAKKMEAVWAKAEETLPSVVPEYGTPEFWDYHRKKKAAENARRAAEGLPPLPTKKEIEAEKAKKRAEREAKKVEKEKLLAAKKAAK